MRRPHRRAFGLRRVLEEQADLEVVAEAGTAAAAVQRTAESHPGVVVMDLGLPDASGIDATRRVRDASPSTAVLVLTVHDDVGYLRQAFAAGATGYLVKDAADPELVAAVRTVAAGGRHVHPRLGAAAVGPEPSAAALAGPAASCPIARSRCSGTSPWALPNAEIAARLYVSVRTIETHRAHIHLKLGVRSRAGLVAFARDAGLLTDDAPNL